MMAETELFYNFNNDKRGIALLIHNEEFDSCSNLWKRKGDTLDYENMVKIFSKLGFEVLPYRNLNAAQIDEKAKEVASLADVHKNSDCFACVIATHGEETLFEEKDNYKVKEHVIFGNDGKPVETRALVKMFDDCEELKDKPKFFFIQACRIIKGTTENERTDEGFTVNMTEKIPKEIPSANNSDGIDSQASHDKESSPNNDLVPQVAYVDCPEDTLLMFASLAGNYAVRNPVKGGWLLSSLYNQVDQNLSSDKLWTTDFIHILNGTLNEMAKKQFNNSIDGFFSPGCLMHALTKDVLFTKKT